MFNPDQRINLGAATVLLADGREDGAKLLVHILSGFGVHDFHSCTTLAKAQKTLTEKSIDLLITDAVLADGSGYELVSWLRRSKAEPNCYAPAVMVTGHSEVSNITKGRDCGANFVVAKPLTPAILLDRILWVARENRPIIDAGDYIGPDRRFRADGPPPGIHGRRREDLTAEQQAAAVPQDGPSDQSKRVGA